MDSPLSLRRRCRSTLALLTALVLLSACGGDNGEGATIDGSPGTTAPASPTSGASTGSSSLTSDVSTGSSSVTSIIDSDVIFDVAAFGRTPEQSLGDTAALGSGCAPGTNLLPDGLWFGWVESAEAGQLTFDLACLWPGRLEPAVSNDSSRIRPVSVSSTARVYQDDDDEVSYTEWFGTATRTSETNAPGLPQWRPHWLFVNDGAVTEISRYPSTIRWVRSTTAWANLIPGCCDAGDVAPPSPTDPWPDNGWPADGFYPAMIEAESDAGYELAIGRWLSCEDALDLCPPYWLDDGGDEVIIDPDEAWLRRLLPFDSSTTAIIAPIFSDSSIVGDGAAFGEMRQDLRQARADLPGGESDSAVLTVPEDLAADPDYPFGVLSWPDGGRGPIGYRGPGGSHLTPSSSWWLALEIRSGEPYLYIHAGMVAG